MELRLAENVQPEKSDDSYSYDVTPYESYPFPQSHPDLLRTLGRIYGLNSPPVASCSVLELGCAAGGNLIPLACNYPESQFLGLDLSQKQIEAGQKIISDLGLSNIQLEHADIMKTDFGDRRFDYIIAHGVFSWVQPQVQTKLLNICQEQLSENGVAYVSFNTLPGWRYRSIIRDIMLYHTRTCKTPAEQAAKAREVLEFLSNAVPGVNHAHGMILKGEFQLLRSQPDYYLLHDYLEESNIPVYFHEFVQAAENCKLKYLSEVEFYTTVVENFSPDVSCVLQGLSSTTEVEQYIDYLTNRTFRQTLLCRESAQTNRTLDPLNVCNFFVSSWVRANRESYGLDNEEEVTFATHDQRSIRTKVPLMKCALHKLQELFPQCISFEELFKYARDKSKSKEPEQADRKLLAEHVWRCYSINMAALHSSAFPFVSELGTHPKVSALARYQASNNMKITSQLHKIVDIDVITKLIIMSADGSKNQRELLQALIQHAKSGELIVDRQGAAITDYKSLNEVLAKEIEQRLSQFAKSGLLVD